MNLLKFFEMAGRKLPSKIKVEVGGQVFFNQKANKTFADVVDFIAKKVGVDTFIEDNIQQIANRKIIGLKIDEFPVYQKNQLIDSSTDKFIISSHSNTAVKKYILDYLFDKYDINGKVEIIFTPEMEISNNIENYYLLGAYSKDNPDWWKQCVEEGKWYNGFALAGQDTLKDKVNGIPVGANVAIKSTYTKGRVNPAMMIKAIGVVTKNYEDGTQLDVDWVTDFTPFEIVRNDVGGYRSTLHEVNNQEHIDLIWNLEGTESEPTPVDEPEVQKFGNFFPSSFKAVQAQEEKPSVTSPFIDSICILGSSGKGKSYTTELILDSIPNLEYEFIIPSASTTNLLAQFSPGSERGGYVTSRLGKLIMKAHNNPTKNYVAVFDECHKAIVIEMINDELLQCISTKRNKGRRFISLEEEIADLYKGLSDFRGNLLIPDNFGFVFLSSKPDVIISNADFFNRVNIYVMVKRTEKENIKSSYNFNEDGKIELNTEYFKYFTDSEAEQIKREFDDAKNKL